MHNNSNNHRPTTDDRQPNLISDEIRFLIACCQTDPSKDDINFIHSYPAAPNTDYSSSQSDTETSFLTPHSSFLIPLASRHGVLPLIYKTLKSLSQSNNSNHKSLITNHEILSAFKQQYLNIAQRNMLMSAELIRIMKLLRENDIEALAFKGPALSQMAYGDITLRQYVDLDILVDENDAFKAGKLMSENGHTAVLPLKILKNKTCLHTAKDFSLMSKSGGVHTELHWRLFEKKYNISLLCSR